MCVVFHMSLSFSQKDAVGMSLYIDTIQSDVTAHPVQTRHAFSRTARHKSVGGKLALMAAIVALFVCTCSRGEKHPAR